MKIKKIEFAHEITDPHMDNLDVFVENEDGSRIRLSLVHQAIYLTKWSKRKSISSCLIPQKLLSKN